MDNASFVKELRNRGSYLAMNSVFSAEEDIFLEDFQTVDTISALQCKRYIIVYETGLGKTYIAGAIMRILSDKDKTCKHLMVCLNAQLEQTPNKVAKISGLRVKVFTAKQEDILALKYCSLDSFDVMIVTQEVLNNIDAMQYLYTVKDNFKSIIVDEAHEFCNYYNSSSGELLRSVVNKFKYAFALTATPITTSSLQLAQLTHIFRRDLIADAWGVSKMLDSGYPIIEDNPDLFTVRTRQNVDAITNYKVKIMICKPMKHQKDIKGEQMFNILKGDGATRQVRYLIDVLKEHSTSNETGLVYIRHHNVRDWVCKHLDNTGIRYACVNGEFNTIGSYKKVPRTVIYDKFRDGEIDVILTSVTHGIDLECDYIFFYEFFVDIKQMLGRGHRGLNPKDLLVYFLFTLDTGEIPYFINKIYERSLTIQMVLHQVIDELLHVGRVVKRYQSAVNLERKRTEKMNIL